MAYSSTWFITFHWCFITICHMRQMSHFRFPNMFETNIILYVGTNSAWIYLRESCRYLPSYQLPLVGYTFREMSSKNYIVFSMHLLSSELRSHLDVLIKSIFEGTHTWHYLTVVVQCAIFLKTYCSCSDFPEGRHWNVSYHRPKILFLLDILSDHLISTYPSLG